MANRITIPIGTKFGRLTVIDNSELKHLCRCECGTIKAIDMYSLLKGDTMSCGCFHREMSRDMLTTHGLSKTRLHSIWAGMLSRCHNENQKSYKNYGGRGIQVCEEWRKDFKAFYDWAYSVGYNEEFTETGRTKWVIDRIDNDGDYCPENCRWITNAQNMDNTRRTRRYEYNGENLTLREWSNKTGLSRDLLSNRINGLGWSVEKAITTPVKEKYRHLVAKERKEMEK